MTSTKLAAGTVGELIVRTGYTSRCHVAWYFRQFAIKINGESVFDHRQIVYPGDIVTIGSIDSITVK